jgi:hypothetical protein
MSKFEVTREISFNWRTLETQWETVSCHRKEHCAIAAAVKAARKYIGNDVWVPIHSPDAGLNEARLYGFNVIKVS